MVKQTKTLYPYVDKDKKEVEQQCNHLLVMLNKTYKTFDKIHVDKVTSLCKNCGKTFEFSADDLTYTEVTV